MTPEGRIVKHFIKECERRGWEQRKLSYEGRVGAPDRLLLAPGYHALIEFKAYGQVPTAMQVREHIKLRRSGMEVFVCDTLDSLKALMTHATARVEAAGYPVSTHVAVTRRVGGKER